MNMWVTHFVLGNVRILFEWLDLDLGFIELTAQFWNEKMVKLFNIVCIRL
jgi:hypothetical protein